MKLALVGATGLVGREMIKVLEERKIKISEFIPVASEKSVGKKITFNGNEYDVKTVQQAIEEKPNIALFSAGAGTSEKYAPLFAATGCFVIDNSSAWRMNPKIKLVVPEINAECLTINDKIIANPNCSTIQLVVAINPLHKKYTIKRMIVSTYQAITGTGIKAVRQMEAERKGCNVDKIYPYQIDKNCIPQCDVFIENGYTKEEMKVINETQKILNDYSIAITSTAVRVPVTGGHSESVNLEFEHEFEIKDVLALLQNAPGIMVEDDPTNLIYPMAIHAQGKDEVFVGRIRRDYSQPKSLNLWVVADNLRKGAATNAVQIAEYIVKNFIIMH